MISDVICVKGAAQLPETVKNAIVGLKASQVIESRYLRSEHAREARILKIEGSLDGKGAHALVIRLDRCIGTPLPPSKKPDPVSLVPVRGRSAEYQYLLRQIHAAEAARLEA